MVGRTEWRMALPTFEEREHAFEAKFAHDEEFRFLVSARRDKLFAHWAAATLKLSRSDEDALVKAVLAISDARGHDEALLRYVAEIMSAHGHVDADLSDALAHCGQEARRQLIEAPPEQSEVL